MLDECYYFLVAQVSIIYLTVIIIYINIILYNLLTIMESNHIIWIFEEILHKISVFARRTNPCWALQYLQNIRTCFLTPFSLLKIFCCWSNIIVIQENLSIINSSPYKLRLLIINFDLLLIYYNMYLYNLI